MKIAEIFGNSGYDWDYDWGHRRHYHHKRHWYHHKHHWRHHRRYWYRHW